jgi:alpha-1,2-mannosyltransferase
MLASGLITLAHRSGGPLMDILVETEANRNGFLAVGEQEYADAILSIIDDHSEEGREAIRDRAKASVGRFGEKEFETGWIRATEALVLQAAAAAR